MNDFFSEKQKKERNTFAMDGRDAPFDAEREWEEARFAQFYLEQQNQKSNIYFAEHQRKQTVQAPQRRRIAEHAPLVSRFSFLWRLAGASALGGALVFSFLGAAWWWGGGVKITPAFAAASGAYADILSAQQAFVQFDFEKSKFLFYAAHERAEERAQSRRTLAAYAQGALISFTHWGDGGFFDVSALEQEVLGAAKKLAKGIEPLFQISPASFFHTNDAYMGTTAGELIGDALLGTQDAHVALRAAYDAVIAAGERDLSEEMRARIDAFAPQFLLVSAHTEELITQLKFAVWALGMERPRKFLVIAQDSAVARPTGGAIRSVGVITAQGGVITNIAFDDVYGIDSQLQINMVPPEPIQKVATAWALHDANWFLDFPLSAKKIAYFYEKSGGGEVDGVVAFNDHAVKKILALTGPVKGNNGVPVNGESRSDLVRTDVLRALGEVLPTFSGDNSRMFMQTVQEGLREKDILVWLAERDHQEAIAQQGWSGEVISEEGADYLAVVSSDIESDAAHTHIKEDIWKETHIAENGDIINTVAVQFVPENGADTGYARYIRIYVPSGSELLETSGLAAMAITPQIDYLRERFAVDNDLALSERITRIDDSGARVFEESGKTVFGGWVTVGEKNATVIVRYRLPFSFIREAPRAPMTFVFQKQPGIFAKIHFSIVAPEGMQAVDQEGNILSEFSLDGTDDVIMRTIIK